jgi:quinol monooxygenase YgiN
MICVVATIKIKPGQHSEFLAIFNANVPAVLAENGCIEYFPTIDIDANVSIQAKGENEVVVIEKWESVAALHAHFEAPHMISYKEQVKDMVVDVSLRVLEESN